VGADKKGGEPITRLHGPSNRMKAGNLNTIKSEEEKKDKDQKCISVTINKY
jgi:hypothetical protein